MKTLLVLCVMAGLAASHAAGQSTSAPSASSAPPTVPQPAKADLHGIARTLSPAQLDAMARFQTALVTKILGVRFEVDGVLPRMRRADHPLHMINPFAPARYGTGLENVSADPRTGRMEGISLLSLKF